VHIHRLSVQFSVIGVPERRARPGKQGSAYSLPPPPAPSCPPPSLAKVIFLAELRIKPDFSLERNTRMRQNLRKGDYVWLWLCKQALREPAPAESVERVGSLPGGVAENSAGQAETKKVVRRIQEGCKKDAFSCVRIPKDFFGRIIKLSHLNHRSPVAAIFPSGGKYEHSAVFQIPCWTRRQPDPIFPAYQPGAGRRGRYHARLRRIRWHAGERQFWYLWSFHPLPTGATWRFTPLPATW